MERCVFPTVKVTEKVVYRHETFESLWSILDYINRWTQLARYNEVDPKEALGHIAILAELAQTDMVLDPIFVTKDAE